MRGPSPPWARAEVDAGAHAPYLRAGLEVLDRPLGEEDENGPRPTGTMQHIPAKPAAFIFFSLEASITCNSLEVIYIKTIKYDLSYKLTSNKASHYMM